MTTSAVANTFAQDTNAHFQAWYNEVITALFTTLGVTQTGDTGQIGATASIPAINTSAGYVIGRFNDTLQGSAPIFFKLEFGSGAAITDPQMWLTVGTGSNGSGTITNGGGGAVTTRCAILVGTLAPISLVTSFTSRYCYNGTTQIGCLWMGFKYNALTVLATTAAFGGFVIARTSDNSGNASGQGVCVLTPANSATNPGNTSSNGYEQNISFANSAVIPAAPANNWESMPQAGGNGILSLTTLLQGTTSYVPPIYTVDPVVRLSAYVGTVLIGDFAFATTSSFNLVGSTPITYISAGQIFSASTGYNNNGSLAKGLVLPWQ